MHKHYLITRFNLRKDGWELTKNNESLLTDEWMEHRLWLFRNFCFTSVVSQSNQNFNWLIFFDRSTKEKFREQIHQLCDKETRIQIFFIDGMTEFYPSLKDFIKEDAKDYSHIITSRLDNDDCIHVDYIDTIQQLFENQYFEAIDILNGYTLQISEPIMLGKKEHIYNPFISLIEINDQPKTVWFSDHNLWKTENRIKPIKNKRLWMSIIHERNKVNEFDGYDDVSWNHLSKYFNVSKNLETRIAKEILPQKNWKFLSFKNKMYVNFVLASKRFKKALGVYKIKSKP